MSGSSDKLQLTPKQQRELVQFLEDADGLEDEDFQYLSDDDAIHLQSSLRYWWKIFFGRLSLEDLLDMPFDEAVEQILYWAKRDGLVQ